MTQYEWRLDQLDSPDSDITSTLSSIAQSKYDPNRQLRLTPKPTSDITPSPLCDLCDFVFKHLKPGQSPRRLVGGAIRGKTQSIAEFKRSAAENTCHFCRLRWNQLRVEERESVKEEVDSSKFNLYHGGNILSLEIIYKHSKVRNSIYMVPCKGEGLFPLLRSLSL
jgi:hypothetical protein